MATGIIKRHSRRCRSHDGGRCSCDPSYRAEAYSKHDGRKIRKTFARESEARAWRAEALSAISKGAMRAPTKKTIREAGDALIAGMESGEIRQRSGERFKPKTIRGYRQALRDHVYPEIGSARLSLLATSHLQGLVDRWRAAGLAPSTIRNAIKPLQVIYRRARSRDGLPVNPTRDLELPAPDPREVEIVPPRAAARLLAAVPDGDRPVWATALYAGLRYGELRALSWDAVDLAEGIIHVRQSWDAKEGRVAPKTPRSRRRVPIPAQLRDVLLDHRVRSDGELAFARTDGRPFDAATLYRRADRAWEGGALPRLRLHQARHTYASFMIAAGVNAKALTTFMGHSSITVTYDLYGHLMPGTEAEAAALLNAYLGGQAERAEDAARGAGADPPPVLAGPRAGPR
jgi:integrase